MMNNEELKRVLTAAKIKRNWTRFSLRGRESLLLQNAPLWCYAKPQKIIQQGR